MATLVSPGVSVTVVNESFYATAGAGTVPLVVIATAQNKFQPGSATALASGTIKSNAGKLYLVTSQRDALQTFGTPTFYTVAGSPQYGNELNEVGLFALYEYLGIANTAYVMRADIDLAQLSPSVTEPVGSAQNGDYWLDLNNTSWGVFKSAGNANGAYAWNSKVPTIVSSKDHLETIVQGRRSEPLASPTASIISATSILSINGINVGLENGNSITDIANRINNNSALNKLGITARVYARPGKFYPDGTPVSGMIFGDIYNLRIVCSNVDLELKLTGSSSSVLTALGLASDTANIDAPKQSLGAEGDFAVDTVSIDPVEGVKKNSLWQKIGITSAGGTSAYWFKVGSTDTTYPGWGWREAAPRVITGSKSNPTFVIGESVSIAVDGGARFDVTVSDTSLDSFIADLNVGFNTKGVNVVAKKSTVGSNNYLQIINYDGTDTWLHDDADHTGTQTPFADAGISTSQGFFGSVTGTTENPTYTVPHMKTSSAAVSNAGTGYNKNDVLTVLGGTSTEATQLTVATITVVSAAVQAEGSGYAVGNTITMSGGSYTTPVILRVDSVAPGGAISSVSITQAGQYAASAPSNPVSGTTNGSGIGASFNLTWGVGTVTVSVAGDYTIYPDSPAAVTGGGGSDAEFNLTKGYISGAMLSIDLGSGAVHVTVPSASLDDLISAINAAFASYIAAGLVVASKVTTSGVSYLKISNPNGTNFTLADISGTPLADSGIPVGHTFGKQLIYQGYSPSLNVPNLPDQLAVDNVWINTTPQNRGANVVVRQYQNGTWARMNSAPNTGTIPMFKDTDSADSAFGANKSIGTIFMMYNSDGDDPVIANHELMRWDGTAWLALEYTPSISAPSGPPAAGTYWYNTDLQVDVMVSSGQVWKGYVNAYPGTDPNGPILDASAPLAQSDGTPLADYDLWIDTSDTENYPQIYRYNLATRTWTLIDNTDHSSAAGIIFSDARATADGTKNGATSSAAMAVSDHVDPDAPDALLYPAGLLLFNTRYSTNNVKVWTPNALPASQYPNVTYRDRWVTASGNKPDGTPYMGHWAQRNMVVEALKSTIVSNQDVRAEYTFFNLMATPGYVECMGEMVTLNTDKKEIAFIIGDTPARLTPDGTSIERWASNADNAAMDGPDGLVTHNDYAGIYYPWALSTNLDGSSVYVPPSVMALRTYAYNDQVAYPWFAPAGFNRGLVTGVSSVGYLTSDDTYQPVTLSQGQRDVMYTHSMNPIAYMANRGLVVYGQKTLSPTASAMDRVNVARLINYLKYQLDNLAKPFLFEPNDKQTRQAVTTTFNGFMGNLAGLRAVYDFAIVCDETNNTPERIDRNELWIDVAIKPEKAIEFIYIPIRILNTGDPLPGGGVQ